MTIEINAVPNYDLAASWATFASGEYEVDTDGTRTWKLADDLDRYRAIIETTKPEVIVETGTKFGVRPAGSSRSDSTSSPSTSTTPTPARRATTPTSTGSSGIRRNRPYSTAW